jgi:hypothetical protein
MERKKEGHERRKGKKEDVNSKWMALRNKRILQTERRGTRSYSVENSIWRNLWIFRWTDYAMNEWRNPIYRKTTTFYDIFFCLQAWALRWQEEKVIPVSKVSIIVFFEVRLKLHDTANILECSLDAFHFYSSFLCIFVYFVVIYWRPL